MQNIRLIGVVHVLPLPGTPLENCSFEEVLDRAIYDANELKAGGCDTVILENFGDAPFLRGSVEAHCISMMTVIAFHVKNLGLKIGINILRNDATAAMAIATAIGAEFIRVNVHTGAAWTDQGLIQGDAYKTLQYRRQLRSSVDIAADIMVKHARPAGDWTILDAAKDAFFRGRAKYLIITGSGTGAAVDWSEVEMIRTALPTVPLWIGSGMTPEALSKASKWINGAIVGTFFHENSDLDRPLTRHRVKEFVDAIVALSP